MEKCITIPSTELHKCWEEQTDKWIWNYGCWIWPRPGY